MIDYLTSLVTFFLGLFAGFTLAKVKERRIQAVLLVLLGLLLGALTTQVFFFSHVFNIEVKTTSPTPPATGRP